MLTSKAALAYTDLEGEAFDAAEWFATEPELEPEPEAPLFETGLSDVDFHYLTGEEIWEIEFDSGYRRWYPADEARRILGDA